VPASDHGQFTAAERQALMLIRELRRQVREGELSKEFRRPAHLAHYLIAYYHGHVQLRMSRVVPELGVTMRTLERSFHKAFHTSMRQFQIEARLKFAKYLLSSTPGLKMSVVAKELGYDDPNVFERFFHRHADNSPHAWSESNKVRRLQDDFDDRDEDG
jgi:AraC-like DNA-binding protein